MDKFRVFVYMLMRDASLKQRVPCIMLISIFGAFSAGKKGALYTGKYGSSHAASFQMDHSTESGISIRYCYVLF